MEISSRLNFPLWLIAAGLATILPAAMLVLSAHTSRAGSATWSQTPGSGDWNTVGNWTVGGPPNGPSDTATFATSSITAVSCDYATVNGIVFNASSFTINVVTPIGLTISGVGITNNSGFPQNFVTAVHESGIAGMIQFTNSATAGSLTAFTNNGGFANGGGTFFHDTSTAGNGTFTNNGGVTSGGNTGFGFTSTAGNGTFTNNGGAVSGAAGGYTIFSNYSTAGNGTFICNPATVSNAYSGGSIRFYEYSTGGTARVKVFGTGNLDFVGNGFLEVGVANPQGLTIGSIEGNGLVYLGVNNLTVGSNNLSTTFSGLIWGVGANGSLTKIGTGTLTLSKANTYTGGTTVNGGTLEASHDGALGVGNVSVTASGATLTLENGVTNNYIANTASLSIVSGSTVNLNFTGDPADTIASLIVDGVPQMPGLYGSAASGAPHQLPEFAGPGTVQVGTSGCSSSLNVTRLSQGDPRWGSDIYDHTTTTIRALGCALTSLTMAMNYAGLSGVTPGTLNNSANAIVDGYGPSGNLNWGPVTSTGNLRFAAKRVNSVVTPQAANDYLDQVLCELERPVVAGVFNTPGTGAACNGVCHFVLVTGRQSDGRYVIADPGNAGNTTLDAYGNRFETRGHVVPAGPGILRVPLAIVAGPITEQLSVTANGRVSLLVLDAAGNKTGIDPVSGERTEEIPNSAHFIDSLTDDVTEEVREVTHSVYVEQPVTGRYEIRVTASEDGPFRLSATTVSADGAHATPLFIDGVGVGGQTQVFYVSVGNLSNLGNISTRLRVETGDNVLIGGFIVTGTQPKKVIVRAIGPSLPIADRLANPTLELRDGSGGLIAANDNWRSFQEAEIIATTIPPSNDLESAIVATLPANNAGYTAIVRGVNNGTGIGVVEAYDLNRSVDSKLANISTRGLVQTGDNVLIAGTIVLGQASQRVLIRAIGPSLNLAGKLADPTLELRDGNGGLIRSNDNWRSDQEAEIITTGIPPTSDMESAIVEALPTNGAAYTAIVRGVNGATGVAVVEVYALN